MSFFDWLNQPRSFTQFEDHYALTRESLLAALQKPVNDCVDRHDLVLLVAHFPDCFTQIENQLEAWGLNFEVVVDRVDQDWVTTAGFDQQYNHVFLTLSGMLDSHDESAAKKTARGMQNESVRPVSMMVLERHPQIDRDHQVAAFAKSIINPVRLGYFLSLEDSVVTKLINPQLVQLMQQMGLTDQELVTSNMLTRRLKKVLSRQTITGNESTAESASEWFELNAPDVDAL